jgi:hypothetical protein
MVAIGDDSKNSFGPFAKRTAWEIIKKEGAQQGLPFVARELSGKGISGCNLGFKEMIKKGKEAVYELFQDSDPLGGGNRCLLPGSSRARR